MNWRRFLVVAFALLAAISIGSTRLAAQTTVSQGSIQGTVTDPTGAVVPGAKITITNKATGQSLDLTTSSAGAYNSGGLLPGDYVVRVEAPGFKTVDLPVTVQVVTTSSGNVRLEIGQGTQVVEVQASAVAVNTEQATVQGVLTADQIDKLPIDGRNFLDLAQLEPGVQMQDGAVFDPTKAGYSSVSINGVYGRTPRIELDGLDITDETVGTTTQNIGLSSLEEFSISRSFLDLSTELTAAGAVNLSTRSGTNGFHGMGYYGFRDNRAGFADFPGSQALPFQRNQFGGRFGGPIIKDKLFFFLDAERTKQDGLAPVIVGYFTGLNGGYTSPFRDTDMVAKVDYQLSKDIHVFGKMTYNWNSSAATYYNGYAVYNNKDNAPSESGGVDITKGTWSHSFRAGYLKFHNEIVNGANGLPSFENPVPQTGIDISGLGLFGPNLLAPQGTFQSDKQFKYDGSKILGSHIIRFGAGLNRIEGGGFASFFGTAPLSYSRQSQCPDVTDIGACLLTQARLGNGQGFFTEKPGFNLPAGGQDDWRFSAYIGDSWKLKPNFTLTYGLRYNRDTGRTDSDLAPIPCSAADPALITCTGNLLDQWGPGLGNRVRQPNNSFGPQLGFAWDPLKDGKTVIRAGAGMYYENSIFNNTLFDRPAKLATGLFNATGSFSCPAQPATPGTVSLTLVPGNTVTSVDGLDLATQVCGQPLTVAGPAVADLQTEFQAAVAAAGPAGNPNYVGNTLELSTYEQGLSAYAPNYRPTRSYQFNFGVQRELWPGAVLTADYLRNVSLHFPLTIDVNHVGAARYFNAAAAANAIAVTTGSGTSGFGCGGGTDAAAINCAIGKGATIDSFAGNGLDSGLAAFGGSPAAAFGLTPDTGAAFPGVNPLMGVGDFEYPMGRSVYNALQMEFKQSKANPFRYADSMNLQVAYTLSRFVGNGGNDQNFSASAWDNDNPTRYIGPTSLDRLNQFKFGWTVQVHHGPQFSVISAFSSAPPTTLTLENNGLDAPGEIFRTDFTGDGTAGDLFPAFSKPGQYGRSISAQGLAGVITNYNTTQAGTLTPAGQTLLGSGLFTATQLQELGAVKPYIAPPPPGQLGNGILRNVNMVIAWPIRIRESVVITPSFSAFNVFNFSNYNIESGLLANSVDPAVLAGNGDSGSATGTGTFADRDQLRVGTGSGVFSQLSPRQLEFGLKLDF